MGWFKNLAMVVVSILIPVLCFEIYLRVDGRYSHIADVPLSEGSTIWTRSPNTVEQGAHPDLPITFDIAFDANGVRQSSKTEAPIAVGYFGDSFTENRRLENAFSINEYLNQISSNSMHLNFGVDGFGMEQAAQRWMNLKDTVPTDIVVYVFCANDLRNTYEAEIFAKDAAAEGELVNIVGNASLADEVVRLAGRLHLTYLVMDGYYQLKGMLRDPSTFKSSLVQKFVEGDEGHKTRFHDDFADSIVQDLLSPNPGADSKAILSHFQNVLALWRKAVEDSGKTFVVAVLPRDVDRNLAEVVFDGGYDQVHLARTDIHPALSDYDFRFKNNGHWNEVGNLSGALSMAAYFKDKTDLQIGVDLNGWTSQTMGQIEAYYAQHASVPAKP